MRHASYLILLLAASEAGAFAGNGGVWSAYDTDRNGLLEPSEFAAFCAGQPHLKKNASRFERFDIDGDGHLSQDEFVQGLGALFKSGAK